MVHPVNTQDLNLRVQVIQEIMVLTVIHGLRAVRLVSNLQAERRQVVLIKEVQATHQAALPEAVHLIHPQHLQEAAHLVLTPHPQAVQVVILAEVDLHPEVAAEAVAEAAVAADRDVDANRKRSLKFSL